MKPPYNDIIEKLGDPQWWDDNGTPRYCEFHPKHVPCIYAREALLYEIQCQACRKRFNVSLYSDMFFGRESLQQAIRDHKIHYGDPPNAGCCPSGPTMSSEPLRVIQFWYQPSVGEWKEVEKLRNEPLE